MSKITTYKNEGSKGTFCQIKLDSGERILISIYGSMEIKIIKLWFRVLPVETVWGPKSIPEALKLFFNKKEPDKSILDMMMREVLACKSIAELKTSL